MHMMRFFRSGISVMVLVAVTTLSLQAPAHAGMVGTGSVIDQQQVAVDRGQLLSALDREGVREQLVAMGVDPQAARERVAALSDQEIQSLSGRIQELPAGGDILGVAVLIFLVLLLTDILGYTKIFPFIKKTVN